jgi:hypothetical protein
LTSSASTICSLGNRRLALAAGCLIAVCSASFPGCRDEAPVAAVKQSQQDKLRQFDRADALLKAAANQLNDLPAAADTEIKPAVVILDSQKVPDHQDVYAVCIANPAIPDSPINVILVPAGNSRFKGLGVRSGDTLKYFVKEDNTVDDESRQLGFSRQVAMELKIAQVIDDNTLLIEAGLNQQVDFPAKIEIWRNVDTRQKEINEKLVTYAARRLPPLAWEPAPDEQVLTQVLAWLNQWVRQTSPPTTWKRDEMLDKLPADLAGDAELKPYISPEALAATAFTMSDARILQEAVWLRDIARWAHGDSFDDVGRATALFDWTIRNIQLEPDDTGIAQRPWHVLLYGRGTATQRAWVFALLCRQQGLNVVMLGIPQTAADPSAMYWLPALVSNGQLYLFDTRLGLPIAGPDGKGVATLEQALKDDALLRKLDLEGSPYLLTAEKLKGAQTFIVADPFELSRRASQLEAALSGSDRLSLVVKPSEIAKQLNGVAGVNSVALWGVPFRTLLGQLTMGKSDRQREALAFEPFAVRPNLWKARTRHVQGRRKAATDPVGDALDDHKEAVGLYMKVRPSERKIAGTTSVDEQRVESSAKHDATYWLGLLSYDDGKFEVASDWFRHPELNDANSTWKSGASYNLGRSLEAQQKTKEAIPLLEKDASPQQQGNKIRARELKLEPEKKSEETNESKPSE